MVGFQAYKDKFLKSWGQVIEVGANDPRERSQTWHLEQQGWTGVLIEPQPDLAAATSRVSWSDEKRAKVETFSPSAISVRAYAPPSNWWSGRAPDRSG